MLCIWTTQTLLVNCNSTTRNFSAISRKILIRRKATEIGKLQKRNEASELSEKYQSIMVAASW